MPNLQRDPRSPRLSPYRLLEDIKEREQKKAGLLRDIFGSVTPDDSRERPFLTSLIDKPKKRKKSKKGSVTEENQTEEKSSEG